MHLIWILLLPCVITQKGEACPLWPGHPATLHWGLPDPALVIGTYEEQEKAFKEVRDQLKEKIENLINKVRYMR